MCRVLLRAILACTAAIRVSAAGLSLAADNEDSIKANSAILARGVLSYYANNKPGIDPHLVGCFPYPPYYWWESGAVWAGMIDYWAYTKDASYVDMTVQAMMANAGTGADFMLPWHEFDTGNDDQAFWALGAMSAAELQFPNPPANQPQWLTLAINTFNTQVARWDVSSCNGGLRWQVFQQNKGFDYKNAVSNGAFFQLAARLARYTGNTTYSDWAERAWDWSQSVGMIGSGFEVYDGANLASNCSDMNRIQWTYNNAIYLYGSAVLANMTASQKWIDRTSGLLSATPRFFSPFDNATNVMFEASCETVNRCNTDQFSFKAYLSRWLAKTTIVAPWTKKTIYDLLTPSALAAAASCTQGDPAATNVTCGTRWYVNGYDGVTGLGQQLSAFETVNSLLAAKGGAPISMPGVKIPCYSAAGGTGGSVVGGNCAVAPAIAANTVTPPDVAGGADATGDDASLDKIQELAKVLTPWAQSLEQQREQNQAA